MIEFFNFSEWSTGHLKFFIATQYKQLARQDQQLEKYGVYQRNFSIVARRQELKGAEKELNKRNGIETVSRVAGAGC
jgi:hypothetical protein|tara:strand:+ start:1461 stop:1691 length:231 start_codon:yes stop_codon:yes gene_type:complete